MISKQLIEKLVRNPRQLFLIDGIGAILSAFLLGVILVQWESSFGMPRQVLYYLAAGACIFAVYSLTCYIRIPDNWRPFLKAIAYTNLMYCCASIVLVFYHYSQLTHLGLVYFILEVAVLIVLISIELKTASKSIAEKIGG